MVCSIRFRFLQFLIPPKNGGRRPLGRFAAVLFILAASLSGPFSVVDAAAIVLLWLVTAAGRGMNLESRPVDSVKDIIAGIDPTRLVALFLGASVQLATMLRMGVRTPIPPVLTAQELKSFGLVDYHSVYVDTIMHPSRSLAQWVLLCAYAGVFIFAIFTTIRSFSKRNIFMTLLLLIGISQPIMAYAKQQHQSMLSPISHYYYFFGVIALCSAVLMLRERPAKYRGISVAAVYVFISLFLIVNPKFLIRPQLTDMNWQGFAAKISAGQRNVKVPLNPGWRAIIGPDKQ